MPATTRAEETGEGEGRGIEARLAALEQLVDAMTREVVTRRLVVVDALGRPRLVADISRGTAELRLEVPNSGPVGPTTTTGDPAPGQPAPAGRTAVVLHATPGGAGAGVRGGGGGAGSPDVVDLGPSVGLQLWADGDAVAEFDIWPDGAGRWCPHVHLAAGP